MAKPKKSDQGTKKLNYSNKRELPKRIATSWPSEMSSTMETAGTTPRMFGRGWEVDEIYNYLRRYC
ncbi:MAG: hypothetical protein ACLSE8_15510 [Parasutterella sp.]